MRFKFIPYIIFSLFFIQGKSQNFYRSYGNSDDEIAKGAVETKDSAFFIFGTSSSFVNGTSNFYLMRIDSLGNFEWSKTYGDSGIEQGNAIAIKPNGHYLLTGYSNSFSNGGYDIYNIEIDSLGDEIWSNTYGGNDWDFAYDNTTLSSGNSIITGSTFSFGNGNQDGFLMMIDDNGDSLWMQTYGNTEEDVLRKTIQTSTGFLLSVGYTTLSNGDKDMYVVKSDINGDTVWTKKYGSTSMDEAFSVCEAKNGNYIISGYTEGLGAVGKDGYYFETDTSGNVTWTQVYGVNGDETFNAICIKPDASRFFAAWESESYGNGGFDFVMNNFYSQGGWNSASNTYGTDGDEKPYDIIYTNHNRVLAVGSTNSPFGNLNIMVVLCDTLFPTQLNMVNYIDVTAVFEEEENPNVKLFPNPSADKIQIQSEERINKISLADIYGNEIYFSDGNPTQIDVSKISPAVYFMRITFVNGNETVHRIVVTRR